MQHDFSPDTRLVHHSMAPSLVRSTIQSSTDVVLFDFPALPQELRLNILCFLGDRALAQIRQTCHYFNNVARLLRSRPLRYSRRGPLDAATFQHYRNIHNIVVEHSCVLGWGSISLSHKLQRVVLVNVGLVSFPSKALEAAAGTIVHLDLSANKITEIGEHDFSGFIKLETLSLNYNLISKIAMLRLPSLRVFWARHNRLQSFPHFAPTDSLESIDLSCNRLGTIYSRELAGLSRLLGVVLTGNLKARLEANNRPEGFDEATWRDFVVKTNDTVSDHTCTHHAEIRQIADSAWEPVEPRHMKKLRRLGYSVYCQKLVNTKLPTLGTPPRKMGSPLGYSDAIMIDDVAYHIGRTVSSGRRTVKDGEPSNRTWQSKTTMASSSSSSELGADDLRTNTPWAPPFPRPDRKSVV